MADTELEPIVKSIEVPCGQEQAFNVFVNEMDSWWPLGKFTTSAMAGAPAKAIRVEAKKGGKIPAKRAASMDLPAPGGPIISMLWPPAAATSNARLAVSWPRMSNISK
jgi:hypothetical protein